MPPNPHSPERRRLRIDSQKEEPKDHGERPSEENPGRCTTSDSPRKDRTICCRRSPRSAKSTPWQKEKASRCGRVRGHRHQGSSAENRAGFQRMIADATSSKNLFEMIIVYDISRFTRKTKDLLNYRDLLERAWCQNPVGNRTPQRGRSFRRGVDPRLSRQRVDVVHDGQENPRQPV